MNPRPPLEAVVFDAGGTLVRLDFEWMVSHLGGLGFWVPVERLRRAEVEGRRRYDASLGHPPRAGEIHPPLGSRGDTRAYFAGMLEASDIPSGLLEPALADFFAHHLETGLWNRPMEGAREAIDRIAAMGIRRAVVSNSDGRAERHLSDHGVRDGLEFVIDSQRVGCEKPDPRIFAIALERLGVAPERALYVGDIASVDERGAAAAGMPFVLIDPYGDYAGPSTPNIRGMHELPEWIGRHFTPLDARETAAE